MLPAELLQDIFNLLLFTPHGRRKSGFVRTISNLRGVSWSWRELLGRTPTFWTHISSEDHIDFVSEALKRSYQAPLHLKHIGKNGDDGESPFLDETLPYSHRWESVTLHQPNDDVAAKYFSASAPIIKAFLLSIAAVPQPGSLGGLFGGALENLEELRVASCESVDWKGLSCVGLRTLDIEGETSLDMGVMFNILIANPKLQILRFENLTFAEYVQPKPTPPPIHLHDLQELTLKDIKYMTEDGYYGDDSPIARILQRIRFRPGTTFIIKEELQTEEFLVTPEEFMSLIPSPVDALAYLHRVDGLQSAEVQAAFEGDRLELEIKDNPRSKPTFSVDVRGLPQTLAKNWVVGALREVTTPINLRLQFRNGESTLIFLLDEVFFFQLWESVVDLALAGNFQLPPDFGRSFLRLLSTRFVSGGGSLVMPFPKLQHLRLTGISGIKAKDMLAMVRARFASPAVPTAHGATPVPMTIHCGNGVGGWRNKYMDDILATPGVTDVREFYEDLADIWSSSSSSGSEWPPPNDYFVDDFIEDEDEDEISSDEGNGEAEIDGM
ncbi:hypothetical protein FRC01_001205 [Tulasnella sp. 417]|nr:hypothetical protein FRC01_001205 [Tulasnella sp. 417]